MPLHHDDALEILKLAIADIERIKQQQWRDFYKMLAVRLGSWFFFSGYWEHYSFRRAQQELEYKFRARKNLASKALGPEFASMWGGIDPPDRSRLYPNIALIVLGIGTACTILLMLKFQPALFWAWKKTCRAF